MGKDVLIMFFGTVVLFLPFLGFPNSWDTVFLVFSGLSIIALGILVRRERGRGRRAVTDMYTESAPEQAEHYIDHDTAY